MWFQAKGVNEISRESVQTYRKESPTQNHGDRSTLKTRKSSCQEAKGRECFKGQDTKVTNPQIRTKNSHGHDGQGNLQHF